MLYVMRVDKTRVVTTGKRTAVVPGNQSAFDGRGSSPGEESPQGSQDATLCVRQGPFLCFHATYSAPQ